MKITIRMDDITPDMDWEKFLRFKNLCDSYQIKPLIGVVPDSRDEALHIASAPRPGFWEYIEALHEEGWQVAQHGVTHVYAAKKMGCFPLNRLSEFAGKSYEEQREVLSRGKTILESHGITTDIFMAPAHSFDRNTIKALKALGFTKMTDGFGNRPYTRWGMTFYPISYRQSSSLKKKKGYTTFVVHANTMNDKDFERYEKMFAQYRDRLISYAKILELEPQRRSLFGSIKEYTMAVTKFLIVNVRGHLGKSSHGGKRG